MNSAGNETLDRIQQEIREVLEREEELRTKYQSINSDTAEVQTNGHVDPPHDQRSSPEHPLTNGTLKNPPHANGTRLFTPNPSSKGVMQKFLKARGKLQVVNIKTTSTPKSVWTMPDDYLVPAKYTVEAGKPIRNGFIPAEEKMRRELKEFQKREEELRTERRKSQPDLMAALEKEAKSELTRTTSATYSSEDLTDDSSSAPPSLKRARSLAALCDASEDEIDAPGTLSLIRRFESLQHQH